MYNHILIPLDGSHLSEQVIPHALAQASLNPNTRITLLRALPFYHPAHVEGSLYFEARMQEITEAEKEAKHYLERIAPNLRSQGYQVHIEISHMLAEEAIIDYAEHHDVDLITIATHGRSGVRRWFFGSVTQKVIQASPIPVMVIRPSEEKEPDERA